MLRQSLGWMRATAYAVYMMAMMACQSPVAAALERLEASGDAPALDRSTSLLGLDADQDAVRDDLERIIAALPDTPEQKAALTQTVNAFQDALTVVSMTSADSVAEEAEARAAFVAIGDAVHCLWTVYGSDVANDKLSDMRKMTFNTRTRFDAYAAYGTQVSGFAMRLPEGDTCAN